MTKDANSEFPEYGTGLISEALGIGLDLSPPPFPEDRLTERPKTERLSFLDFLERHHGAALENVCFVDLTIYKYGRESLPRFHVIAPGIEKVQIYKQAIKRFLTPRPQTDPTSPLITYSVALHPEFRTKPSLRVIRLSPLPELAEGQVSCRTPMQEEAYQFRTYGPHHFEYPRKEDGGLDKSLEEFKQFMSVASLRRELTDPWGRVVQNILCCNFLVSTTDDATSSRCLAQLFLGISCNPFENSGEVSLNSEKPLMVTQLRALLSDFALLLYRNASGSLMFAAGQSIARQTFSHETKKLLELLLKWCVPITEYFDAKQEVAGTYWSLRTEKRFLKENNLGVVPLLKQHRSALRHMLPWTMASSISDLPFYDEGLPETFEQLAKACFQEAWNAFSYSFFYSLTNRRGGLHKMLDELDQIDSFLRSRMPAIRISGDFNSLPKLDWHSDDFKPLLIDFSRLLLTYFRETFQHGSWIVPVELQFEKDSQHHRLTFTLCNQILNDLDISAEAASFPRGLKEVQVADFIKTRQSLDKSGGTLGNNQRSGQSQTDYLAQSAGGHQDHTGPHEEDPSRWVVRCAFPLD